MNFKGSIQIVPIVALQTRRMDPVSLISMERQLSEFNVFIKRNCDTLIRVEVSSKKHPNWNEEGIPDSIVKAIGFENLLYNSRQGYALFPKYLPYSFLLGCAEDDVVTFNVGKHNIDLTCSQGAYKDFGGSFEQVLQNVIRAYVIKDRSR